MNFFRKLFGKKETDSKPKFEENKSNQNDEESYGIDKEKSHQRAIALIPE